MAGVTAARRETRAQNEGSFTVGLTEASPVTDSSSDGLRHTSRARASGHSQQHYSEQSKVSVLLAPDTLPDVSTAVTKISVGPADTQVTIVRPPGWPANSRTPSR